MDSSHSAVVDVKVEVNGRLCGMSVESRVTLLDALRDQLGLTGTKKGCDQGPVAPVRCCWTASRCVVSDAGGGVRRPEVTTIEGLASNGDLHPMQASFLDMTASNVDTARPVRSCRRSRWWTPDGLPPMRTFAKP